MNYAHGNTGEDRRDVLVFFIGLGVVFGTAGAYLAWRLVAGKIPLYFATIALGLFVIVPPLIGSPSGRLPMIGLALIAAVALVASAATGIAWGEGSGDSRRQNVQES